MRYAKILLLLLLLAWLSLMFWNTAKPLPPGTHLVSRAYRTQTSISCTNRRGAAPP